tara:strand:+ start:1147 stop:5085 length:3939 start_codon:yes stop_codon:yes gene_type:complete
MYWPPNVNQFTITNRADSKSLNYNGRSYVNLDAPQGISPESEGAESTYTRDIYGDYYGANGLSFRYLPTEDPYSTGNQWHFRETALGATMYARYITFPGQKPWQINWAGTPLINATFMPVSPPTTNPGGVVVVNTVITAPANSQGILIQLASGLKNGAYTARITNQATGKVYETPFKILNKEVLKYNISIDIEADIPGSLNKTISLYPTTAENAYAAFYGDRAVIDLLTYRVTGNAYAGYSDETTSTGQYGASNLIQGALFVMAKLKNGGSGYRPNAFYPIWNDRSTVTQQPASPFEGADVGNSNNTIETYFDSRSDTENGSWVQTTGFYAGRTFMGAGRSHVPTTYGFHNMTKQRDDAKGNPKANGLTYDQYHFFGQPYNEHKGEVTPVLVALTDSTGSVTQLVEYDEEKYGHRLYNDRTSGPGLHWLHFHSTYYGVEGGSSNPAYRMNDSPQYVTYLDPATGSHLTDSTWVSANFTPGSDEAGNMNLVDYYDDTTGTFRDPFEDEGGADIVAILTNSSHDGFGAHDGDTIEYVQAPDTFHTLDPEEDWFDEDLGFTWDTMHHDRIADYGQYSPPGVTLGPGHFGTTPPVGSPVYSNYNPIARHVDYKFRAANRLNLSKRSIEFTNITGNSRAAPAPAEIILNDLEGSKHLKQTVRVDFDETLIDGLTAISQTNLAILKGDDLELSVTPSIYTENKLKVTPNVLEGVYGEDTVITEVKEYCVLEVGAMIPNYCINYLSSLISKHPGDPLSTDCVPIAGDNGSSNWSLYSFYIRLKAKGTGYPPNSKIPVYIRRGADHVPGYDVNKLPANPGPTLEYGHLSDITVDGRGSSGPCVCMIHTDDSGVTTHITEYVDPKSKCESDSIITADVNDGVNYDGAGSPVMRTDTSEQWYRERPSQYRRLMNLGEVSNSIYGYAKDYIAPVDLVDETYLGKAKWSYNSNDFVLKAYNFGCLARMKELRANGRRVPGYIDNRGQITTNSIFAPGSYLWKAQGGYIPVEFETISDQATLYYDDITPPKEAEFLSGQMKPGDEIGEGGNVVSGFEQIVGKSQSYIPAQAPYPALYQYGSDTREYPENLGKVWHGFRQWQCYRDAYKNKGITYNRSTNLSDLTPVGKILDCVPHGSISDINNDSSKYRNSRQGIYYKPGTKQDLLENHILFDRHGCTNEGFDKADKVRYPTDNFGPDYIICRIATPNKYFYRGHDYAPHQYTSASTAAYIRAEYLRHGKTAQISKSVYGTTTQQVLDSYKLPNTGLQGQTLVPIVGLGWAIGSHSNWVSLGDSDAVNGGRPIVVEDSFSTTNAEYIITPGVYNA